MSNNIFCQSLSDILAKHKSINSFFENQVKRTPNKIAIEHNGISITYDELNKSSNRLARALISKGIKQEDIVAISIKRSIKMITSILAIIKAGAAYLPIDINSPKDRVKYMISNSSAKMLIYSDTEYMCELGVECLNINDDFNNFDSSDLNISIHPNNLAYVIYTSGSTGLPKGVMIEHGSVINRLLWMRDEFGVNEKDVILQKTLYTFDVSVWEIFLWFFAGAKLYLYTQGHESNPEYLVQCIYENKITICHFVPSMLNAFLKHVKGKQYEQRICSLRKVFSSGEALNYGVVHMFNDMLFKKNMTELYNLYGPTEATVDVTSYCCTGNNINKIVPIGKPIVNTNIYIVRNIDELCEDGEVGEICIAGANVGRGYINNLELTNQRFVKDLKNENKKMYKTGDLGKWNNGNIEYIGRLDNQVKIRGYRVELEEIEAVLLQNEQINQAVVSAIDDYGSSENKTLIALFNSSSSIDIKQLREYLHKFLPEYMIPSQLIDVDYIPTMSNGKIDRKAALDYVNTCINEKTNNVLNNASSSIKDEALSVIKRCLHSRVAQELPLNVDLQSAGIDSISFLEIIVSLEEEFNIEFDNNMLVYTGYKCVQSMLDYVEYKVSSKE